MAAVKDATEAVAEVADEVAESAEAVAETARALSPREIKLVIAGVGVGIVGGALVGAAVASKRLATKYEKIAEGEISQMRDHFRNKVAAHDAERAKPSLEELETKVEEYAPTPDADPGTPQTAAPESETKNVFEAPEPVDEDLGPKIERMSQEEIAARLRETDPDAEWDYTTEIATRNENVPYVIHRDERKEKGYVETTLTYYDADDILCDEDDVIIEDKDTIIGPNLDKFGHGSGDPNIVYIRHDLPGIDIELCRSPNSYAEEVHGLKHGEEFFSTGRRRRHFDDEE